MDPNYIFAMANRKMGLAFQGEKSVFSNFYTRKEGLFQIDGEVYVSSEQFYQAAKCRSAQLPNLAKIIMDTVDPKEIKRIGNSAKRNRNYLGDEIWHKNKVYIMKQAVEAKFSQNKDLADKLKETSDYVLIEANANDKFWGAGLPPKHFGLKNSNDWPGQNILGQLLMEFREKLKQKLNVAVHKIDIEKAVPEEMAENEEENADKIEKESVISEGNMSSDNNWSKYTKIHYFVSQMIPKEGLICHRMTDSEEEGPWTVLISDELLCQKKEKLCISDVVEIHEFVNYRSSFQVLNNNNWLHKATGKINWQCMAKNFVIYERQGIIKEPAIIIRRQNRYWDVVSASLNRTNRASEYMFPASSQFNSLALGKVIEVGLVILPVDSKVGDNYVLPNHSPFLGFHKPINENEGWVVSASRTPELDNWIWPPSQVNKFYIETYEKLISAAVLAARIFEHNLCNAGKISAKLAWFNKTSHDLMPSMAYFNLFGDISRNVVKVWKEDSMVYVRGKKTFANAWITEIVDANNSIKITLEFNWDNQPKGSQNIIEENSDVDLQISTYDLPSHIRQKLFRDQSITNTIESNTSQGKILSELIGLSRGDLGLPKEQHKILHSDLNEKQNQAAALFLDPNTTGLIVQEAPPGTGKSKVIADIAIEGLKRKVIKSMAILAPSNQALEALVNKFMPQIANLASDINSNYRRKGQICLLLVSDAAKVKYKELFQNYKNTLLIQAINDYQRSGGFENLHEREINILDKYRQKLNYHLRNPNERQAAEVMGNKIHPLVIFTTLQMGELLVSHFSEVSHLLLDEMGKASFMMVASVALRCLKLEKMFLTGDSKQLQIYERKIDKHVLAFGFQSPMELTEKLRFKNQVTLDISYRSHPALIRPLSEAYYQGILRSGIVESERSLLSQCAWLPAGVPLLIIDCKGFEHQYMGSFSNPEHTKMSLHIFHLLAAAAPVSKIVILTYYRGQARDIALKINPEYQKNIKIVDGFQGEENDIIILVLTATRQNSPRAQLEYEFIHDRKRAAVATSRAREGLVIIADLELLTEDIYWRSYIDSAKQITQPLTAAQAYGIGRGTPPAGSSEYSGRFLANFNHNSGQFRGPPQIYFQDSPHSSLGVSPPAISSGSRGKFTGNSIQNTGQLRAPTAPRIYFQDSPASSSGGHFGSLRTQSPYSRRGSHGTPLRRGSFGTQRYGESRSYYSRTFYRSSR